MKTNPTNDENEHPACAVSAYGGQRRNITEQIASWLRSLAPFGRKTGKGRVRLFIDRSTIEDAAKAEETAVGIYRQVARRPFTVVQRTSDETHHIFVVDLET